MNEREKLIELINQAQAKSDDNFGMTNSEQMADFLLENGVIVPPVKVGDTFFYLYFSDDGKKYQIDKLKVLDVSTKKVFINEFGDTIGIDEFGTTAFINYTAAKEAVERLNNEK